MSEEGLFKTEVFSAKTPELAAVWEFVSSELASHGVPDAEMMRIELAVEEVFVNIASYAYPDGGGDAKVSVAVINDDVTIRFEDRGVPFDPLKADEPDTDASLEEREIGGLGIFLVKEMMDDVRYEYKDGKNILTFSKHTL